MGEPNRKAWGIADGNEEKAQEAKLLTKAPGLVTTPATGS